MSNGIDESMKEVLNEIPSRVSNRLLLGAIIETRTQLRGDVERLSGRVRSFEERLSNVEDKVEEVSTKQVKNPSVVAIVRENPIELIKLSLIMLSIMLATVGIVRLPEWVSLLLDFIGG